MKIVVVGGGGRIGTKLVHKLRQDDQRVLEASPRFGVNTVTGVGLTEALRDACVVVDVSNSPTFEDSVAMQFFETSAKNLVAAARAARVRHYIVLSIVGVDRLQAGGYFRAKKMQEDLIKYSGIPYTIIRSTQFFEFIAGVVQNGGRRDIEVSPALVQPISGENLAEALADAALDFGLRLGHGRIIEVAGPERFRLADLATEVATAYDDRRRVIPSLSAPYFGAVLQQRSLLPGPHAHIARMTFEDWLRESLHPEFHRRAVIPRTMHEARHSAP